MIIQVCDDCGSHNLEVRSGHCYCCRDCGFETCAIQNVRLEQKKEESENYFLEPHLDLYYDDI